jgi:hypothetical protein
MYLEDVGQRYGENQPSIGSNRDKEHEIRSSFS